MDLTTGLTGMLPAIMLVGAPLAAVASMILLRLYRRATVRAMSREAVTDGPPELPSAPAGEAVAGGKPLVVHVGRGDAPKSAGQRDTRYRRVVRALRATGLVYASGGAVYALILTIPWLVTASGGFRIGRLLWLFLCYAWPTVLVVGMVAATGLRARLRLAAAYVLVTLAAALFVLARSPELTVGQLAFFWLFCNAPGTLLWLAFLNRRVRAVGPLVLAFMVVGVAGAFLAIQVVGNSDRVLRAIVSLGSAFGLRATTLLLLVHGVGFVVFGLLGWWLLNRIGKRYRAKRSSDQSLTVDALWLLFGIVQSITLAFEHWAWIFTGLVGFVACKLTTSVGFARMRRAGTDGGKAPVLLLLRVFALGRRSAGLFDTISNWWRRSGGIVMVAGPDLVTSAVEPHEFLDFLGGRLSRQFVQGDDDLERRVTELDRLPDPDGRYRVQEFFCHADTWKMTMRRLARESRAVLMDLRSFSRANAGCRYELEQLLDLVDLRQVVFLVDGTTDSAYLDEVLHDSWSRADRASPNRSLEAPTARLFEAEGHSVDSLRGLLLLLFSLQDAAPSDRAAPAAGG